MSRLLDVIESQDIMPVLSTASPSSASIRLTMSFPRRVITRTYKVVEGAFDRFVFNGNKFNEKRKEKDGGDDDGGVEVPVDTFQTSTTFNDSGQLFISQLEISDREVLWVEVVLD